MKLITTSKDCAAFCKKLAKEKFITVDTEFMRERSYYAKLCLIQVGGSKEAAAIDPLAEDMDLAPLFKLFANKKILKVFHAARQDVEIFVQLCGKVPTPLFDTQVAAMVCGYGEAASYQTLAQSLAKAKIDKSSRFTDWSRRPLSDKQLEYALADVTHLRVVYEKIIEKLEKTERTDWVSEEMTALTDMKLYEIDPYKLWEKFKLRTKKPKHRAILREIVAWRELEAQSTNNPRGRVIRDDTLLEIATHPPKNEEELAAKRGIGSSFANGRLGTELLKAVRRGERVLIKDCPPAPAMKKKRPQGTGAVLDMLKVLLRQVSDKHGVAPRLIATNDELDSIAADDKPKARAMSGWRLKLFGKTAKEFKAGKLALAIKNHKVVTIKV